MIVARAWRALLAFTAAREDALSLSLCRAIIGLAVVTHVGAYLARGAAHFGLVDRSFGGLGLPAWGLPPFDAGAVTLLCVVLIVAGACVALGVVTRPALVVVWLGFRLFSLLNKDARGAYDSVIVDVVFVLMLSGCGRRLALDALWSRGGPQAARWPRMLLVMQMGWLYTGSALTKVGPGWVPGGDASALWHILHQPLWARFSDFPLWLYPVTQLATTSVWIWKLLGLFFVLAVFLRESSSAGRLKRALDRVRFVELYLLFGVGMHLGIELTMDVGAFGVASLALYPAAIHPDRWRRWLGRVIRPLAP